MSDQIDYEKINQRVARRLKQRKDFQGTVLAFFIVTGVTWAVYLMADQGDPFVWPIIPTIVMGIIALWGVLPGRRTRERTGSPV